MNFSASQSAFASFGLLRRHPGAFLVWTILFLLLGLLAFGVLFLVSGPVLMEILQGGAARASPSDLNLRLMPGMLAVYPLFFALSAVINAAIFRAILRPEQKSFAYLRLGPDELRLFAISVIAGLVVFVIQFLVGMLRGKLGLSSGSGLLFGGLLSLAYWCLYCWAAVRVCLWAPQAFAERRIAFARAWRLSAGRFWPLLGMVLLILAVSLGCLIALVILATVVGVVATSVSAASGHGTALAPAGGPSFLVIMGAIGVAYLLWFVFVTIQFTSAFASAYRSIAAPPDQAEVFS